MRRLSVFLPLLIALTLMLAACPAAAPTGGTGTTTDTGAATEAATEPAAAGETETPAMEATEEMTGTPEMEATGTPEMEMTGTPAMEATEEMTGTPEAEGTPEMTGTPEAGMAGMVMATNQAEHGEILTDGEGRTLYLFTEDVGGTSTCTGECATAWPPFTVEGEPVAGEGVDQALLGLIPRDDGTTQVTYNGHPLYYYAEDVKAGDVTGQRVGGVWFLVNLQGQQVE